MYIENFGTSLVFKYLQIVNVSIVGVMSKRPCRLNKCRCRCRIVVRIVILSDHSIRREFESGGADEIRHSCNDKTFVMYKAIRAFP